MKILIDNGHGENTSGKRSPDGRFRSTSTRVRLRKR
ncbi:TPA_asm: endolysin [Porphyromonas phage phage028a_KCOM2799]|uniref:Endolysin n=1 Tax=Porphyromonas phage phage028a_KCOM2799 TaxID=3154118 RepID=A0AAT9J988_9CAUD